MHSRFASVAVLVFAFSIFFEAREMQSQEGKTKYPRMAPVEEYLMPDRNAEMALARSAAPESISHEATVLVLDRTATKRLSKARMGLYLW